MAKSLTVRFYRVGKVSPQGPSLRAALQAIVELGLPGHRQRQLTGGFVCRLERFSESPGFLAGEMTRVKATDHPSAVHPHGAISLGLDVPIGEGIAFHYREADHVLAIEYDPRVLSPGRFNDYIGQMHHAGQYTFEPSVDPTAIARFRAQPLRKLRVKLARPTQLGALENDAEAAGETFRFLAAHYEAPVVTLEMSMGHYNGALGDRAKQMIEGFLQMAGHNDDVRGISVTPDAGEGIENEDINLLDSLLSVKGEVVLTDNEPDTSYGIRSEFVRAKLNAYG